MSDRLAVMNAGRIEQVGTPAEVYEEPATGFVAGFVGVSNVLSGEVAQAITGFEESFTIRPEKIRMTEVDEQGGEGECTVTGHVRDVVYVGALTRYVIDLDPGGVLVVLRQNLTQSSMDALEVRGRPVRLSWNRELNRKISEEGDAETGRSGLGEEDS